MTRQTAPYLQSDPSPRWFVGVDIGGTKVDTLLVDAAFTPRSALTFSTALTSPMATLRGIEAAICETLAKAEVDLKNVTAIGLGVPGQVEPQRGVVNLAVNLNWDHFPAGELLATNLGVPCFLENDVRAAALGVYRFSNPAAFQHIAYVSIGTGVSAGLILQGRLYRGVHGMAGEFGHSLADPNGPRCNCGAYGCLETFIGGPAIARLGRQAAQTEAETLLQQSASLTAKEVYAAAQAGDIAAGHIVEQAGVYLGRALQQLIMFYDVEWIVLGGGVARAGDTFLQPLLREWERQRAFSALAQTMLRPAMLHLVDPDQHIGTWGAVAVAEQGLPMPSRRPMMPPATVLYEPSTG
ncbi:MAG: ROK family protein [Caldilineaceae bacterium]